MAPKIRTRVETGIRSDIYGFQAQIKINQRWFTKRFPPNTPIQVMRDWRDDLRATHAVDRRVGTVTLKAVTPSPEGWSYVYFIRCRQKVKIGRAVNVGERVRQLQTGHADRLVLLAALPGHAIIEAALHERFARLRDQGEWFILSPELEDFIEIAKATQNLVGMLWGIYDHRIERLALDRTLKITRDDETGQAVAIGDRPIVC